MQLPDVRTAAPIEDEMGMALNGAEAVQRKALEAAQASVWLALQALKPFEQHGERVLAGIARAVKEERDRLLECQKNLGTIVTLHLDHAGASAQPEASSPATGEHA